MSARLPSDAICHACGHDAFEHTPVLWPALIKSWELSEDQAHDVDVQQGTHCASCGANVRSIALALAIARSLSFRGPLTDLVKDRRYADLRVLEINAAGGLHPILARLPRLEFHAFPECDMMRLGFASGSVDMIIHSDTLEHIPDPLKALEECRRVLVPGGTLAFTVPVIPARLTRSRAGLPPSYHGYEGCTDPDFQVHTEFGADVWTFVLRAGFTSLEFVPYRFPSGLAMLARTL